MSIAKTNFYFLTNCIPLINKKSYQIYCKSVKTNMKAVQRWMVYPIGRSSIKCRWWEWQKCLTNLRMYGYISLMYKSFIKPFLWNLFYIEILSGRIIISAFPICVSVNMLYAKYCTALTAVNFLWHNMVVYNSLESAVNFSSAAAAFISASSRLCLLSTFPIMEIMKININKSEEIVRTGIVPVLQSIEDIPQLPISLGISSISTADAMVTTSKSSKDLLSDEITLEIPSKAINIKMT